MIELKIIIAPSKTMKYKDYDFDISQPIFQKETDYIYSLLKQYNDEQLCELMKISYKQATKVYDYYHQRQELYPALSLYQGTVFKQLEIEKYNAHHDYLHRHLC
ncbi:MAG: peroxide stress protein YaaA, partial [Coprobacillus sp.]